MPITKYPGDTVRVSFVLRNNSYDTVKKGQVSIGLGDLHGNTWKADLESPWMPLENLPAGGEKACVKSLVIPTTYTTYTLRRGMLSIRGKLRGKWVEFKARTEIDVYSMDPKVSGNSEIAISGIAWS